MPEPTQVKRPWRATVRTVFQAVVGLAVVLPFAVDALGLDAEALPWLAGALAVAAGVTRVMALPQVNDWLAKFLPFLAAEPKQILGKAFRGDGGHGAVVGMVALMALVVFVVVSCYFITRGYSDPLGILGKASNPQAILGKAILGKA